jgi:conjugal transfer ATP-binding protein TraC
MSASTQSFGAALRSSIEALIGADALETISKQFRKPDHGNRDPGMFSSYLPYLSWDQDREMFGLNEGNGFVIELMPQSGADDSTRELLKALYLNWHGGSSISIHLFGTPHIAGSLEHYVQRRIEDLDIGEQIRRQADAPDSSDTPPVENVYRRFAKRRAQFYNRAAHKSIVKGTPYVLRDFRLILSVVVPGTSRDVSTKDELMVRRDSLISTLRAAGFPARLWNPDDLINWTKDVCNPYRLFEPSKRVEYDEGRQIRDQIVDLDTRQSANPKGITFSKSNRDETVECRLYAVKSYPRVFELWSVTSLIGDNVQMSLQYPCPFMITLGVHMGDPAATRAWVATNQARATQNANSKMAGYMPDAAEKKKDWDEALRVMDQGGGVVKLYHTLALWARPSEMPRAESAAEAIWRDEGFELNNITYLHRPALVASMPMALSRSCFADLERLRIPTSKSIDNAVDFSPLIAEWRGTATPAMIFAGRRGQLAFFDFYDNFEGNYNFAIAGTSGSGKSVALNEIAWSYLGEGAKVWLLDLGRSFEKLCSKANGQAINLFPGCGLSLNPFTHIVDFTDDIAMLQGVVAKMAAPLGQLDNFQYQAVADCITIIWRQKGTTMSITDVRDLFATGRLHPDDDKDTRLTDLATMLSPYAEDGAYGEFFHPPCNIDFSKDLIVIETEDLKRSPAIHRAALMILMFRITSEMYFTRNRRKLLIIDELKQQIGTDDDPIIETIIDEAARRARKYGGALGTATQQVDDYYESSALKAAFTLADTLFIMRQRKESIELLANSGRLSMDVNKKKLLQSLRLEKGAFAEMYIYTPQGEGVFRLVLDPAALLLYSNRIEDNAPLDERMARGMSIDEAIADLLRERGVTS